MTNIEDTTNEEMTDPLANQNGPKFIVPCFVSESKKSRSLMDEPMGNKPPDSIPGIGKETAARLRSLNNIPIVKASQLLGLYLYCDNVETFRQLLTSFLEPFHMQDNYLIACSNTLESYAQLHV